MHMCTVGQMLILGRAQDGNEQVLVTKQGPLAHMTSGKEFSSGAALHGGKIVVMHKPSNQVSSAFIPLVVKTVEKNSSYTFPYISES